LELSPGTGLRPAIDVVLSVAGVALFAFGSWAALVAPRVAAAVGG
jgi:hypothetical protein